MILKLSLTLPEDGAYVRIMRRLCRALLEDLNVIEECIGDLELVIAELCTNVIRHANDHDGRYEVHLEFHASHAEVTVIDTGQGFAFKDVPEPGTERQDTLTGGERIGGYGMGLVRALTDRLEFRRTDPHGTTVHARLDLQYPSPEDAEKAEALDRNDGSSGNVTVSAD